jgi:hypothetical protein
MRSEAIPLARIRSTVLIIAATAVVTSGCASGFQYRIPPGQPPAMRGGEFEIAVKKLAFDDTMAFHGAFVVDVDVKNVTDHVVVFDPHEVVVYLPDQDQKFEQTNVRNHIGGPHVKGALESMNVAFVNPLPPGATYSATLWFELDRNSDIRAADVAYRDQRLHFPRGR